MLLMMNGETWRCKRAWILKLVFENKRPLQLQVYKTSDNLEKFNMIFLLVNLYE